jgi:hypothetical protein
MDVNAQVDKFRRRDRQPRERLARQGVGLPSGNHPTKPSPLTPDEFDEVPRSFFGIHKMWIFSEKSRARARSRPNRFTETRLADSIGPEARPVGKGRIGPV